MIRYVVTTHEGSSGANLSREGSWGNLPHTSPAAAREAASRDAGDEPYTIRQQAIRRRIGG